MFAFQAVSEIKNVQINPAAKNPLYKPWLAANPFVGLNNSSANVFLNTFFPFVSHANISSHKKYKCSAAISPNKICLIVSTLFIFYFKLFAVMPTIFYMRYGDELLSIVHSGLPKYLLLKNRRCGPRR